MSAREIFCPRCRTSTVFSPGNPYRPFCSERCKLIDLGAWAEESYKVPTLEPLPEDLLEADFEESIDAAPDAESKKSKKI